MQEKKKIPVTIITGFLGAGKTTFINSILKNNAELKFALVENEFGEVAIDPKLVKGVEASRMFELKNGCICCTISNEYELALAELAEQFPDVNHLLIETTGIADPAPVIRPFFADYHLRNLFHYNGTVCLVDALNYHRYPAKRIAWKQISIADNIFITKAENFDDDQQKKILDEVRIINPLAKIELADRGEVKDFSLGEISERSRVIPEFIPVLPLEKNIQTKTIRFKQPLNMETFKDWLTYNLDVYKEQVYRVKGILSFENEPYHFVLQGVGGSFELEESEGLANGKSELVFIGNLQKVDLVYPY